MLVTCLGSGDAFGSGGRMNTSFFFRDGSLGVLLDCGATTVTAMKKAGLTCHDVDVVLISHLHGDHIAGLAFLITERQVKGAASHALNISGPPGIDDITRKMLTMLFPGIGENLRFPLGFTEYQTGSTFDQGGLRVHTYPAVHAPPTRPHSLRVETENKIIAYSGDTEWNDNLVEVCRNADLFICEGYGFNYPENHHMSVKKLMAEKTRLTARKILLTHLSEEALNSRDQISFEIAEDGMSWQI